MRPFNIVPNGLAEITPRFHVLFVRNENLYKVNDWTVTAGYTEQTAQQLSSEAFRATGWRVSNVASHLFKNNLNSNQIENRYAVIFVKDSIYGSHDVRVNQTYQELMALPNQDFRVVDLDQFGSGSNTRFNVVIVPNTNTNYKRWAWIFGQTKSEILKTAENINNARFRVTDIELRSDGKYNALLVESKGEVTKWYSNLTNTTIYNDVLRRHGSWFNNQLRGGARFTDLVVVKDANNSTKFELLTMENGVGEYPIARDNVTELKEIDDQFIRTMSRHGVPGASFAMTKNGKVIYRAAYGYANLSDATPANRNHRGRIASISKIITAAAIMKLIQEQKLSLDSKVFGTNGLLAELSSYDYAGYNGNAVPTLGQITVRHLLNHTAGWDRGRSGDPAVPDDNNSNTCDDNGGQCEPTIAKVQAIAQHAKNQGDLDADATRGANPEEVIRWMMRPDDKDYLPVNDAPPGTRQVYSNFGFTVLERIIQKVSGMSYQNYVKQMSTQMGVNFKVGKSNPADPSLTGEWSHHDSPGSNGITNVSWSSTALAEPVPGAYSYDMNTMLGHGGWVATPTELVEMASKMDNTAANPWIASGIFRAMMLRPTAVPNNLDNYRGLSWGVEQLGNDNDDTFVFGHGGRLNGSSGLTLKGWYHRKVSMAYLFNSTADNSVGEIRSTVEPIMEGKDEAGVLEYLANMTLN